MKKTIDFVKNHFYVPSFKDPTQLAYEIIRIVISLLAGIFGFVVSQVIYFIDYPLLQVSYIGEAIVSVITFALFYYLIPFAIKAIAEGIRNIVHQTLKEGLLKDLKRPAPKKLKLKNFNTKPVLLDTSIIIDGRIKHLIQENFIDSQIIVPQFVVEELQLISDSKSKIKRDKGKRGLLILEEIKKNKKSNFKIYPTKPSNDVDKDLLQLAKKIKGKVATTDFNLNKVAKISGVPVLNVNLLANLLKTNIIPGDTISVKILKKGENNGQGIGYLSDGTMIVVTNGFDYIGKKVECIVDKVLQTDAGQMIFSHITTSFLSKNFAGDSTKKSAKSP
ncbi:hypothetical protein COV24_03635 [candidate division WWE3 bacterium CG10_big_fil_rev_8_21_14_0_10_32_10]|uniref:TRAM domain-containing protein n=1 Tax=candidate division WWE3 bacterium CG10_big_fil_rev_8_21_14_0_10_32_10 TaxID=1975090 RepID=A0A2H0R9V8_UNCKA|nr:MAG: hypothetical protein COV24_03635 [candidate division WWE3 bacterium CG10_big_fil_rev_8_21_14_0_10_32_10]